MGGIQENKYEEMNLIKSSFVDRGGGIVTAHQKGDGDSMIFTSDLFQP